MQVWIRVLGNAASMACGQPLQPVHDGDEDVLDAPVAQVA